MSENTYRIRPLVWEQIFNHPRDLFVARTVLGEFVISDTKEAFFSLRMPGSSCDLWIQHLEPCKAKAEAYYRERLTQALERVV